MRITRREVAAVAAAALATTIFTAYEVSGGASADPPAASAPANPVPILQRMHVPLPDGASVGQYDFYGNRYVDAQFASGEQVRVTTYASQEDEQAGITRLGPPDDADKVLVGKLFTVLVTGVDANGGIVFPVPVSVLAQESGTVAE